MAQKTLSCTIKVNDNFTSTLNKFTQNIQKSEQAFNKFANSLERATNKIITNINRINTKLSSMEQKTNYVANNISNTSIRQANTMQQNQERVIGQIEQRYQQMEQRIIRNLNNINSNTRNTINGLNGGNNGNGNRNTGRGEGGDNDFNNTLGSLLSGNFGSILGKLGLIGSAITGVTAIAKTISASLDTGFEILNKATGNLFSYDGIKDAMEESMNFETGRQSLDLFYGDKGAKEYSVATKIAKETFASETQTIDIVGKLGMLGIDVNEQQLRNLIDIAGTRPSVSTEHVGLAVQEALEGRSAMLKMYGVNNAKLQNYLNDLKKSNPKEYKQLKGAINKKGTVTDQQKYWLLLNSYIEQSPMHDFANTYAKTVKGKLERMNGVIDNVKAEIMGIDVKTGMPKQNGAFEAFGTAIDALKDKLEDPKMQANFEKMGQAFGNVIGSISDAVIYLIDNIDWESFSETIKEIGKNIADFIEKLDKSGILKQVKDDFSNTAKKVVNNEVIKAETKTKITNDNINGNVWNSMMDWMIGKEQQIVNYFSPDMYKKMTSAYTDENGKIVSDYWSNSDLIFQANVDNSLNKAQKKELADFLKDNSEKGQNYYEVHIDHITANNFDEIMASLKQASNNRK